ncbi:MAG: hypothetical protein E7080_01590 [Bacteroidales bacterium]|nr:hypothetical protein [Bacteroidales bacterium]
MKKILYSLMAVAGLMTTSCISFDDPVTENYGVGPTATITVTEATDSAFTFTVNPGENALYYSILVDQSADTAAVDAESLLKGTYSSVFNVVKNTNDSKTFTYNMRKADGTPICQPGKTYQVYAVAANDKGIIGEIVVKTVSTTDQIAPKPLQYEYDTEEKTMLVLFSEEIARGEGAVKAVSYKYQDLVKGNIVSEPVEEVEVLVDGDIIAITANTYPGAYVAFSWEAGAFVDAAGHPCTALNSGFNPNTGKFVGLVGENEVEAFEVAEENLTVSPELGTIIEDAETFFGTLSFGQDIFAAEETKGAVSMTYTNANTQTIINLTYGTHWDVDGDSFIFVLPQAPQGGDKISLKIAEGAFTDAYGNPNAAIELENAWTMGTGVPVTEETFTGVFTAVGVSEYDNAPVDLGQNVIITRMPEFDTQFGIPAGGCCVALQNLILDGSVLVGYYDLATAKLYLGAFFEVGTVQMKDGTQYGSITYSKSGNDWIEFEVTKDQTLVATDLAWVATDLEYTSAVGFLDKFSTTTLTRIGAETASAKVKSFGAKNVGVKAVKDMKRISK